MAGCCRLPPVNLRPAPLQQVGRSPRHTGRNEYEIARTSGHSLRVGAAQQPTIDGHGMPQIKRAGGWRSIPVVARYVENADLRLWD